MGKLSRNPDLVWRDEPDRKAEILEALEKGGDAGEEGWVIIVDGGQIHQLNLLAGDIWLLCDGTRDEAEIAGELIQVYDAPIGEIVEDVTEFTARCLEEGWLLRKD